MSRFDNLFDSVYKEIILCKNDNFQSQLDAAIKLWSKKVIDEILPEQSVFEFQQYLLKVRPFLQKTGENKMEENVNKIIIKLLQQVPSRPVNQGSQGLAIWPKLLVLIAFAIVAVGFVIYLINESKQQQLQQGSDRRDREAPPPTSTSSPPPVATKKCLILVIDAAHGDIVESIRNKSKIESKDCDSLYLGTQYLGVIPKYNLTPLFEEAINQDKVLSGEESEFDVYLVKIELRDSDAGFGRDVIPIKRRDAFSKLPELADKVEVSKRLRMQTAERFDVYYR